MDNIMIHEKRLPKTKKRIATEENSSAAIRSYSSKLPILGYPLLDGRQSAPV